MVTVLMSDQNRIEILRRQTQSTKTAGEFARTKTAIDQQPPSPAGNH
jgi:hypothetical protein